MTRFHSCGSNDRMRQSTRKVIQILLHADDTLDDGRRDAVLAALEGRDAPPPLLTGQEVRGILKISKSGLRRIVTEGVLVPIRLRHLVRFRQADVERLMEEGCR